MLCIHTIEIYIYIYMLNTGFPSRLIQDVCGARSLQEFVCKTACTGAAAAAAAPLVRAPVETLTEQQ